MKKRLFFTCGFLFFMQIVLSQSDKPTSFFNDYHKLNFQFGVSRYIGAETSKLPNTIGYTFENFTSPHFGLYIDAFQTKKLNFKTGVSLALVREIEHYRINQSEIRDSSSGVEFIMETSTDGMWRVNLPVTIEYLFETSFSKLSFNGSFILGYHKEFGKTENLYEVWNDPSYITTLESSYSRSTAPWYANAQFGVGMYFPFKGWMLRTNLYYNFALQNLYEGTFEFTNLEQSPDTSGKLSFRGDSIGIEFSIYLAKKNKN